MTAHANLSLVQPTPGLRLRPQVCRLCGTRTPPAALATCAECLGPRDHGLPEAPVIAPKLKEVAALVERRG